MPTTNDCTRASSRTRRASLIAAVLGASLMIAPKWSSADAARVTSDAETDRPPLIFRRIGADEATAVEVCRAAVAAARRDVTRTASTDPIARYADALVDGARASSGPAQRAMPDYERDLGPDGARIARTLKAQPASGWRIVDSGLT